MTITEALNLIDQVDNGYGQIVLTDNGQYGVNGLNLDEIAQVTDKQFTERKATISEMARLQNKWSMISEICIIVE